MYSFLFSGNLLSPSPTPSTHTFSRWSTNRLASNPGSTSTSPSGSARSSFNYRQPYLGWRSQERLTHPRTPAERLAAGLLPQKQVTLTFIYSYKGWSNSNWQRCKLDSCEYWRLVQMPTVSLKQRIYDMDRLTNAQRLKSVQFSTEITIL